MKGEQRPQVKLCNVGFFRRQMSCKLNSFCNSSIELITYFRGIGRPPFLSSVMSRGQLKSPPTAYHFVTRNLLAFGSENYNMLNSVRLVRTEMI